MKRTYLFIFAILFAFAASSCGSSTFPHDLQRAEQFLSSTPDSSAVILSASPSKDSKNKKEYAAWCLLDVWTKYNQYSKEIPADELETAADYFLSRGNHKRKAQAYYLLGAVGEDQKIGTASDWALYFQKGCKEVDKTSEYYLGALLYQRYGVVMANIDRHEEAIEAHQKSYDYAVKGMIGGQRVTSLINMATSSLLLGDADKDYSAAIEYAQRACDEAKNINSQNSYSRALGNLSICYSRNQEFDKALSSSLESIKIQEELFKKGIRKDKVRYLPLADAYRKVENADSALFYAFRVYNENPSLSTKTSATQIIYCVYRDILNDEANAVKYMTEYNQLQHELTQSRETDKVVKNQVEIVEEEAAEQRANILLTTALALVLLAVIFHVVIRVYKKRIKERENALAKTTEDLSMAESSLAEKTAELDKVSEEADKAGKEADRVTAVLIDKDDFIESLRKKPKYLSDKDHDKLIATVDKVYDGYLRKLAEENPTLTKTNLRVLCLVKLRFSNPEIAEMMGISPSSVVKAKQRLKGKIS